MAKLRINWRKVGKGLGYFLFFLVLTFLFAYATLPFEKIKARYLRLAEDKLGMDIVGRIEKNWFTGIRAEDLRLTTRPKAGEKPLEMTIDEAKVRLSILPLFLGRLRLTFSAKVGGGEIEGSFTRKSGGNDIEAQIDRINLKELPLLQKAIGKGVGGIISGKVDLSLARNMAASAGKIELVSEGTQLDEFKMPIAQWGNQPFTVPALALGDLRAEVEVREGAAVFKEVRLQNSPDIAAAVEGYAVLQESLPRTTLRAHVRFKFQESFFQRNPKFRILDGLDALKRAQGPDGFYGFLVEGPIGIPAAMQRTPMPRPPPNLTPPKRGAGATPPPPGPRERPELKDIGRRLGK